MSSFNAQRWLAAMSRSTLQDGESSSSSALNPASSVSHQTEAPNVVEPSESPYYSPPPTFMPPESPNMPSYSAHSPSASLAARPIQCYTRPFEDHEYGGVKLAPGQRGSLTAYGQLASSIAPSSIANRGVPGQGQHDLLPPGIDHSLEGSPRQRTPAAEASQANASQGGQLLQSNLQPHRGRISFSDLASQKGVKKWTDETFDDRWVLRSDEMWNVDPRRRSVITIPTPPKSSERHTDTQARAQQAYSLAQSQAAQARATHAQVAQGQFRNVQDVFAGTILDRRRARSNRRKFTEQDVGRSHGVLAASVGLDLPKSTMFEYTNTWLRDPASLREVKKLTKLLREHADDSFLLPSALPFTRRAISEYLRERIFGPEDTRSLLRSERDQLILYGSNLITRDALRKYLFVVVDGMAADMTSPPHDMTRDPEELRLLGPDSPVNTSATDPSLSEDFKIIHDYMAVQKTQKPDMLPNDQQPDRPKSPQTQLGAQWFPDERQQERPAYHQIAPRALQSIPDERQQDQPTSHQTAPRALQSIPNEQQQDRPTNQQIAPRAPQWIPNERQQDRPTNQQMAPGAPQWIPKERQMDPQGSNRTASSTLPSAPDELQMLSNACPSIPHERPVVSIAPQWMPYAGYGVNRYSQPLSYPAFIPYSQHLTDPQGEQQHHQNLFRIPHGFSGPYQQINHFPPQLYAPHLSQPAPAHPVYGRHQHNYFSPAMNIPPPSIRPAAPQRLAPKALRAGLLDLDSNGMGPSGHLLTATRPEVAQPTQQSSHSVLSGAALVFQLPKVSAPTESAQQPPRSAYIAPSSSSQSHPSSIIVAPSLAQLSQTLKYSSHHELAQPLVPSLGSGPFPNVVPTVRPLLYQVGSDIAKPQGNGGSNVKLKDLTRHGKPSFAIATNEGIAPFVRSAKESKPTQWGVVKVSNIPYALTRAEVATFFGRNAKLVLPDFGSPIHIIMDRTTGKTNDCYVEFFSTGDAQAAVNKLLLRGGSQLKLGTPPNDRIVMVEVSSQDVLLKELFPRAKNVLWSDGKPVVEVTDEPFNSGFKGFVTGEEMVMLVRHAEQPHRSSYTQKCPQRTYETMISTLAKFPWHSVENYTVATRNQIFTATREQIKTLVTSLKRGGAPNISQSLLTELMLAGLNASGFSEKQRCELVQAAEYVGGEVKLSPLMKWWPWETLCRKIGSEEEVVEYYASLFKSHPATIADDNNPFGILVSSTSVDLNNTTMEEMGRVEWDQFKTLLRDVLA